MSAQEVLDLKSKKLNELLKKFVEEENVTLMINLDGYDNDELDVSVNDMCLMDSDGLISEPFAENHTGDTEEVDHSTIFIAQ